MHHYSIFELFSIGIGPSSSHTVGPMRAAHRFLEQIRHSPRLAEISGIRCECYGSLAATGHGHGTDTAIMLGLLGEEPHTVEPRSIPGKIARLHQQETLPVTEEKTVRFSPTRDLDLSHYQPLRLHPNGMHAATCAACRPRGAGPGDRPAVPAGCAAPGCPAVGCAVAGSCD